MVVDVVGAEAEGVGVRVVVEAAAAATEAGSGSEAGAGASRLKQFLIAARIHMVIVLRPEKSVIIPSSRVGE